MDITVISSITQNYDNISENQVFTCPYLMFSDQKSDNWTIKKPFDLFDDPNRNAKIPKILSHRFSGEYSLWIDGCIDVLVDPRSLISYLRDSDICFFRHPVRKNAYDEAETCKSIKLDSCSVVDEQMNRYKSEGYEANDLQAGTVILRRHTPKVIEFNNLWWSEITLGSRRDQLSLDYSLWKTGLVPNHFEGYHQDMFGGSKLFKSRQHVTS